MLECSQCGFLSIFSCLIFIPFKKKFQVRRLKSRRCECSDLLFLTLRMPEEEINNAFVWLSQKLVENTVKVFQRGRGWCPCLAVFTSTEPGRWELFLAINGLQGKFAALLGG